MNSLSSAAAATFPAPSNLKFGLRQHLKVGFKFSTTLKFALKNYEIQKEGASL